MNWKLRPLEPLEQENDALKTTIIQLRRKLTNKEGYATKLELVLHQRMEQIDELANTIATLRDQNRRLNEEADHLAELVRMS